MYKSIVEFCDKDDVNTPAHMRHNSHADNEQNKYCNGKSSWEIMRQHEDFKNENNLPLFAEEPPNPQFKYFQETSGKVRVFVLDTSGSMKGEKINFLSQAAKYIIDHTLLDGSWLSLLFFSDTAYKVVNFEQILSSTRSNFIRALPTNADGGTCISCGLHGALLALKNFDGLDSIEESEVILISDGKDGGGSKDLENVTQMLVDEKVVVHCIAVTDIADERLVDISNSTGGKVYAYSGNTSLTGILSEIISGGLITQPLASVTILHDQTYASDNDTLVTHFSIDDGLGKGTTISVITAEPADLEIDLSGPDNFFQNESKKQVKALSLVAPERNKTGQYSFQVHCSSATNLEMIVTSKPRSASSEIIRPLVRLSTTTFNFTDSSSELAIYVHLRKGESPIKRASVKALIEDPQGVMACELYLLDNGVGMDIKAGDGVYTAVLLRKCLSGNGRHSIKIRIVGSEDTVVTQYLGSSSALIDDEDSLSEDTLTGSFQRVTVGESFTVKNYSESIANDDITPPGRITDIQVIDIHTGSPVIGQSRNYTLTWTAPGDDSFEGQASVYEIRISKDPEMLRQDFLSSYLLNKEGLTIPPNTSGKVERLRMVVSSNGTETVTSYVAIVAIDKAGNRGPISNIIPITIGDTNKIEVIKEECTENCYQRVEDNRKKPPTAAPPSLSPGAIVGICFASVVCLAIIICFICWCVWKRQKNKSGTPQIDQNTFTDI